MLFSHILVTKTFELKAATIFCRKKSSKKKSRAAAKAIKAYAFFLLSVKYGKDSGCRMLLSEQRQLANNWPTVVQRPAKKCL